MNLSIKEQSIVNQAIAIIESKAIDGQLLNNPQLMSNLLRCKIAHLDYEVFVVVFMNTQHQLLACEIMFRGTIDTSAVYPREVAKRALELNASAVALSHNHPSGSLVASDADIKITNRLQQALALLEISVLDHIIVTKASSLSFAETGLL